MTSQPPPLLLRPYLESLPLIAVLRGISAAEVPAIGSALVANGLTVLEVPLNSPQPLASIRALADNFGQRCLVGLIEQHRKFIRHCV